MKNHNKRKLSRLNETLNDLVIVNGTNMSAMGDETLQSLTDDQHDNFERNFDSGSQNQISDYSIDDKIRSAFNNAAMAV